MDIYPPRSYSMADGTRTTVSVLYQGSKPPTTTTSTTRGHRTAYGSESKVGAVTPNYVRASATGQLPMLPYNYNKQDLTDSVGTYTYSITGAGIRNVVTITGYGFGNAVGGITFKRVPSAFDFNLENLVRTKVQERLKDQDLNLAQMYAERDQTMRLISTSIKRIAGAYKAARSGNFKAAAFALGLDTSSVRNQSRNLSRGWLELQYGWRPLINDIYGAAATLQKSFVNRSYMTVHAQKTYKERWESSSSDGSTTELWTDEVTKKVTLKVKQVSSITAGMSNLGLTNPATIAWELTPFSFVVDWLVPVGSFISQFDSSIGFAFDGACMTTHRVQTYTGTRNTDISGSGYDYRRTTLVQKGTNVDTSRVILLGFLDLVSLPYFKNPFSVTHVANALALFGVRR